MAESVEPIVEIKNLTKSFKVGSSSSRILHTINFKINPGEFLIINGPSGCGKTTLLNMIAGLDSYDGGEILVQGKDIKTFSSSDLVRYRRNMIGMVFQNFNLISSLSVLNNVSLPLEFFGIPRSERRKRARDILTIFGLRDKVKLLPNELSGGEQQRVAIARALVASPKMLIVDEPTGNLDKKSGQEVMNLLLEINENFKTTIVLVTHDQSYLSLGNRVLFMQDGRIWKEYHMPESLKVRAPQTGTITEFTDGKVGNNMKVVDVIGLSYKHFRYARTRMFLTTLGLAIGICAIVLLVSLGFGLQNITTSSLADLNSLQTISVTAPPNSSTMLNMASLATIKNLDNVASVSPVRNITASGTLGSTSTGLVVKAFNPSDASIEQVSASLGKNFSDNADEIDISDNALKNFGITNTNSVLNQEVTLNIVGIENDLPVTETGTFKIVGVVTGQITPLVYTSLDAMNKIDYSPNYDSVDVQVKNRNQITQTETAIDNLGFQTSASSDLIDKVNKAFLAIELILGLVGGIGLIVASFGIVNTMTISLLERTHEIGIMKAVGISTKDIKRLFIYESSFYGLFGGVMGIVIGWALGSLSDVVAAAFLKGSSQTQLTHLFITPYKFAILVLLFSVLMARLAGTYPAWRASKSSPLEALRYE